MTTIDSGVRTRNFDHDGYSDAEIGAMKKDGDTSAVMNRIRHDAGIGGEDVSIRGNDKSTNELRHEWEEHELGHSAGGAIAHGLIEGAEGTVVAGLAPFAFAYHAITQGGKAEEHGRELGLAKERGAMHLALVNSLQLPQGYRQVELDKWREAGVDFRSGAMKMATQLEVHHDKAAILQLHADRGMNAARDLIEAGSITRDGGQPEVDRILANRPDIKAKYDADPAFRAGFDALVWAKQHDTKAYDETIAQLNSRDRCYMQQGIAFRG
jgi:hypothetical protein